MFILEFYFFTFDYKFNKKQNDKFYERNIFHKS